MKNFTIILLLLSTLKLLAQQPLQWFSNGAQWQYYYYTLAGEGTTTAKVLGTKNISGQPCRVVEEKSEHTMYHPGGSSQVVNTKEKYFFERNDSVFSWNASKFNLIFDFTKKAGDTLDFVPSNPGDLTIVHRVGDTILWGNMPTQFQECWQFFHRTDGIDTLKNYFFKGIGGNLFMENFFLHPGMHDVFSFLTCFRDDAHPNPHCFLSDVDFQAFPQRPAIWREEQAFWCSFSGIEYTLKPIDQNSAAVFFKIPYFGSHPCPTPTLHFTNDTPQLFGYLIQDIFKKRILFRRKLPDAQSNFDQNFIPDDLPFDQFTVLYDFNLQLGQEVLWKPQPNTVSNIDTIILANGKPRRRFKFIDINNPFTHEPHFWIEGIGSTMGLFGAFRRGFTDMQAELRCFEVDDTLQYHLFSSALCDSLRTVDVHQPTFSSGQVRVFPQPTDQFFTIEIPDLWLPAQLSILDVAGKKVFDVGKLMTSRQSFFLPDNLPAGFYCLKLDVGGRHVVLKKMVKR